MPSIINVLSVWDFVCYKVFNGIIFMRIHESIKLAHMSLQSSNTVFTYAYSKIGTNPRVKWALGRSVEMNQTPIIPTLLSPHGEVAVLHKFLNSTG